MWKWRTSGRNTLICDSAEGFHSKGHFDWMLLNTPMDTSRLFKRKIIGIAYKEGKLGKKASSYVLNVHPVGRRKRFEKQFMSEIN